MKRRTKAFMKEWIAWSIMFISTTVIVFNNTGQMITLIQLPFSRTSQYWVAGFSFLAGAIWTLYLDKALK